QADRSGRTLQHRIGTQVHRRDRRRSLRFPPRTDPVRLAPLRAIGFGYPPRRADPTIPHAPTRYACVGRGYIRAWPRYVRSDSDDRRIYPRLAPLRAIGFGCPPDISAPGPVTHDRIRMTAASRRSYDSPRADPVRLRRARIYPRLAPLRAIGFG